MLSLSRTPALACLFVALARMAASQTAPPPPSLFRHSFDLSTGLTFTGRFDATASPRPFAGIGTAAALGYTFAPATWRFTLEASGSHASYAPLDNLSGSERAMSGSLTADLEHRIGTIGTTVVTAGLNLETRAEVLEHQYADAAETLSSFLTAFSTLGPSATITRRIGAGELSAMAALPVVGLVHQPYANMRTEREPIVVRAAGPSALRGGSLNVRYETSAMSRIGATAEYRLHSFDYRGGWATRSLTNSTAIGLVARFGANPK